LAVRILAMRDIGKTQRGSRIVAIPPNHVTYLAYVVCPAVIALPYAGQIYVCEDAS
jgi:hypothetical protein